MITLYAHQKRFIDKNPNRGLLVWETGTGKSYAACAWLNKRAHVKALVVCPKNIVEKWKRDLKEWNAKADVVTRDNIKKIDLKNYGAIVIDEAHDFSSPLFTKLRSQRTTVVYEYVRRHPSANILLLTATPIRSTPWNIHTLATFLGQFWDVRQFQNKFFVLINRFGKRFYDKRTGWQKMIRPEVEAIADIVLMKDCIDVPPQIDKVVRIPWPKENEHALKKHYAEPVKLWHERHRMEQGAHKFKKLKEILDGYRKVIVVCHYLSQIDDYAKQIGEERLVYVLNGSTKNADKVIQDAREADDCVFIIQASMGAGFDASEFSVVVFASMDFKYISWVQMKGRVKRINNLHENLFIHLIGGKCDESVYNTIQAGRDFDVHQELKHGS